DDIGWLASCSPWSSERDDCDVDVEASAVLNRRLKSRLLCGRSTTRRNGEFERPTCNVRPTHGDACPSASTEGGDLVDVPCNSSRERRDVLIARRAEIDTLDARCDAAQKAVDHRKVAGQVAPESPLDRRTSLKWIEAPDGPEAGRFGCRAR